MGTVKLGDEEKFSDEEKGFYKNENRSVRSKTLEDLIDWSDAFERIRQESWYNELVRCSKIAKFTPEQQILIHLIVSIYKTKPSDYKQGRSRFISLFENSDDPSSLEGIKWVVEMYERQIRRLIAAEATIMNYKKQSPKKSRSKTRKVKK